MAIKQPGQWTSAYPLVPPMGEGPYNSPPNGKGVAGNAENLYFRALENSMSTGSRFPNTDPWAMDQLPHKYEDRQNYYNPYPSFQRFNEEQDRDIRGGGGDDFLRGAGGPALSNEEKQVIAEEARFFGVDPLDLTAIMLQESAGTMNPNEWGGTDGKYVGLIQLGESEQRDYGYKPGMSRIEYMRGPQHNFMVARGVKPGDGIKEMYDIINPNHAAWRVDEMESTWKPRAQALLTAVAPADIPNPRARPSSMGTAGLMELAGKDDNYILNPTPAVSPPATPRGPEQSTYTGQDYMSQKRGPTQQRVGSSLGLMPQPIENLMPQNYMPLPNLRPYGGMMGIDGIMQLAGPVAGSVVVGKGDTLWSIAKSSLGPNATGPQITAKIKEIATANKISNPNRLSVGTVLNVAGAPPPEEADIPLPTPRPDINDPSLSFNAPPYVGGGPTSGPALMPPDERTRLIEELSRLDQRNVVPPPTGGMPTENGPYGPQPASPQEYYTPYQQYTTGGMPTENGPYGPQPPPGALPPVPPPPAYASPGAGRPTVPISGLPAQESYTPYSKVERPYSHMPERNNLGNQRTILDGSFAPQPVIDADKGGRPAVAPTQLELDIAENQREIDALIQKQAETDRIGPPTSGPQDQYLGLPAGTYPRPQVSYTPKTDVMPQVREPAGFSQQGWWPQTSQIRGLPSNLNTAAFPEGMSPSFLTDLGIFDEQAVEGRAPDQLSLDAMPSGAPYTLPRSPAPPPPTPPPPSSMRPGLSWAERVFYTGDPNDLLNPYVGGGPTSGPESALMPPAPPPQPAPVEPAYAPRIPSATPPVVGGSYEPPSGEFFTPAQPMPASRGIPAPYSPDFGFMTQPSAGLRDNSGSITIPDLQQNYLNRFQGSNFLGGGPADDSLVEEDMTSDIKYQNDMRARDPDYVPAGQMPAGTVPATGPGSAPGPEEMPVEAAPQQWWSPAAPPEQPQAVQTASAPPTTTTTTANRFTKGIEQGLGITRTPGAVRGILSGLNWLTGNQQPNITPTGGGISNLGVSWKSGVTDAFNRSGNLPYGAGSNGGANVLSWQGSNGQNVTVTQDPWTGAYSQATYS